MIFPSTKHKEDIMDKYFSLDHTDFHYISVCDPQKKVLCNDSALTSQHNSDPMIFSV